MRNLFKILIGKLQRKIQLGSRGDNLKMNLIVSQHQNDIHDKIKTKLNLGSACYHSVENLLSSLLLSNN
jgi:hypothetical protein